LHAALHEAIAAAKEGLHTDLVTWKVLEISGEDGGFALVTNLTVKIQAKAGPSSRA
jgi:hypothetical protein